MTSISGSNGCRAGLIRTSSLVMPPIVSLFAVRLTVPRGDSSRFGRGCDTSRLSDD